ncbi:hypothetical protein D3C81_889510 [compost metagenome]
MLASAALPRTHDGDSEGQAGVGSRRVIRDAYPRSRDHIVHLRRNAPVSGERQIVQVVARLRGIGAGLPEPGDRAHHDAWALRAECTIAQSQAIHDAGPEAFDHGVSLARQCEKGVAARLGLQVEGNTALAVVKLGKGIWPHGPDSIAAGLLHLDDIRAQLTQRQCGMGAWQQLADIQNLCVPQAGPCCNCHLMLLGNLSPGRYRRSTCHICCPRHG